MFFFEKKNQKTFAPLDRAGGNATGPVSKSFLLLFFKKEALSYRASAAGMLLSGCAST
jgi:hypothetical protein